MSRNPAVRSCREAAPRRWRLGDRGIPLCDELKSSVGRVGDGSSARVVAVHCRGHHNLDDDKLSRELGGRFSRVSQEELMATLCMEYGTVTPFGLARQPEVEQVFDRQVVERYFPPHTMMTNLGDPTFAVEFTPTALIQTIPSARLADVVSDDAGGPRVPTFGILTGNAPESGMLLWRMINTRVREAQSSGFTGDIAFPRVIIESTPEMGLSMELAARIDTVRPVVLGAVERLCQHGATVVAIACNTTQYFADDVEEICRREGAQFMSIPDVTLAHLRRKGIRTFDFFGISAVSDFDHWSAFKALDAEYQVHRPPPRDISLINEVAFTVKQRGVDVRALNRLRDLLNGASQANTVVIALTELSAVLDELKLRSEKQFVDTLDVLAAAMAERFLGARSAVLGAATAPGATPLAGASNGFLDR